MPPWLPAWPRRRRDDTNPSPPASGGAWTLDGTWLSRAVTGAGDGWYFALVDGVAWLPLTIGDPLSGPNWWFPADLDRSRVDAPPGPAAPAIHLAAAYTWRGEALVVHDTWRAARAGSVGFVMDVTDQDQSVPHRWTLPTVLGPRPAHRLPYPCVDLSGPAHRHARLPDNLPGRRCRIQAAASVADGRLISAPITTPPGTSAPPPANAAVSSTVRLDSVVPGDVIVRCPCGELAGRRSMAGRCPECF